MLAGWSTNSIDGDPHTALNYLADLGFHSLALTPDRHLLNPFSATFADERLAWQRSLESRNFHCVVETGARHLLDPLQKHEPTLVSTASSARTRRIEFLTTAIDLAVALRARVADIVNVHLDDMRPCIHEHLPLGTGVIRFPPLFAALHECRYTGGIHTELPRQSHRWASEAEATIAFLQKSGLPTPPIRAAKA